MWKFSPNKSCCQRPTSYTSVWHLNSNSFHHVQQAASAVLICGGSSTTWSVLQGDVGLAEIRADPRAAVHRSATATTRFHAPDDDTVADTAAGRVRARGHSMAPEAGAADHSGEWTVDGSSRLLDIHDR